MKLEHFYSDWNGLKTKQNHTIPSDLELTEALKNGKVYRDNLVIIAEGKICEVRGRVINGISQNSYRDIYRILN